MVKVCAERKNGQSTVDTNLHNETALNRANDSRPILKIIKYRKLSQLENIVRVDRYRMFQLVIKGK